MDIFTIVSLILGLISAVLGTHLIKVKNIISDGAKAISELNEALTTAEKALSDNKITADELKDVVKELKEAKDAAMVVIDDVLKLFKK